jgi:hypothetical protein
MTLTRRKSLLILVEGKFFHREASNNNIQESENNKTAIKSFDKPFPCRHGDVAENGKDQIESGSKNVKAADNEPVCARRSNFHSKGIKININAFYAQLSRPLVGQRV